mgnify:CR=1 FL=1
MKITTSAGEQYATVTTASSYQSSSDPRLHFGLGPATAVSSAEIHWPSGMVQTVKDLKPDQIHTIQEAGAPPQP